MVESVDADVGCCSLMRILTTVLLVLVSGSVFAQQQPEETIVADRPGLADGSATVGRGVAQLETGLTAADEGDQTLTLPTLLRFGLSERLELRIESDVAGRTSGTTE